MTETRMDRLLFGDNQFFGINHMSEEKARAQAMRFQDITAVQDVLDVAYDEGIHTFMCTTHDRLGEVVSHIRSHPERYPDFKFFPCMPYAHKYSDAVTEMGVLGAVRKFLPDGGFFDAAVQGGRSLAKKDVEGVIRLLVDAEMKMMTGVSTPVVFLQNVLVDMLLGLGFDEAFLIFHDHVRTAYQAQPGFITMNAPRLARRLKELGIERPIICANYNLAGFRVSGGLEAYNDMLRTDEVRFVAMSVLASGAIPPHEALRWVCGQPNIESIVFGASSRANIAHTRSLVDEFWGTRA
jgi:hypothetical protein